MRSSMEAPPPRAPLPPMPPLKNRRVRAPVWDPWGWNRHFKLKLF